MCAAMLALLPVLVVQWGNQGVLVRGVEYKILRINFFPIGAPAGPAPAR